MAFHHRPPTSVRAFAQAMKEFDGGRRRGRPPCPLLRESAAGSSMEWSASAFAASCRMNSTVPIITGFHYPEHPDSFVPEILRPIEGARLCHLSRESHQH